MKHKFVSLGVALIILLAMVLSNLGVVTANAATNIALGKTANCSSVEGIIYPCSYAVDGNMNTRWASILSPTGPEWIYVDLYGIFDITQIVFEWENAYATTYEIQVSTDASSWATIYSTSTGSGYREVLNVTGKGRYIRMYGTEHNVSFWGYSIWEFEIYGTPDRVATNAATTITSTSATLNGVVNSTDNSGLTVSFEYGPTLGYGTTLPADQSPVTEVGVFDVSKNITGLTPLTTYHYRVIVAGNEGTFYGLDQTFYTVDPPTAITDIATSVTSTGAILNGIVNAGNGSSVVTFEYGLDTSYGMTVFADQSPVNGQTDTPVSRTINGLNPDTTYHYRVVAANSSGIAYGNDFSFTTAPIKIDFSPDDLLFEDTRVGNNSRSQTITVTNNGDRDFFIYSLYIFSGEFYINNSTCEWSLLLPGHTCTFEVTFSPTAGGIRSDHVYINGYFPSDGTRLFYDSGVFLHGQGLAPLMELSGPVGYIANWGSYDFGIQALNTDTDVSFTIQNNGLDDLTLTTPIVIGGADADQFSIQAQPSTSIAPSDTTTFIVRFTPTSLGIKNATISIPNNDNANNPYVLNISGTGAPQYIVTFDGNGGGMPSPVSKSVILGNAYGTLATVSRTGYTFNGWYTATSGGTLVTDTSTVSTASDHTLYAHWDINTYTLTYAAGANGTISGISPQTVSHGAFGTAVTAVPDTGYHFVQWSDGSSANPRTDTNVMSNISVTATFTQDEYTLIVNSPHGTVTKSPDQATYHYGDVVTLSVTPDTGWTFSSWTPSLTNNQVTITGNTTVTVNYRQIPVITWANPADIAYGTALSTVQLNATANTPGTFTYTPTSGTDLAIGTHTLHVDFVPTDTANYTNASKDVSITVTQAAPVITWANPADISYGTPLSATQLNATANVPGTFTYTPAAGTYLPAGTHTLHVDFVPTDTASYANTSKDVSITVLAATIFTDVPSNYWAKDFIERLYFAGVTGGCSTNPLMYCPTTTVTRDQMAVFLLRGEHGSAYTPPPATGTMFADVPQDYWAAAWIEQLANEGITGGCGNGNYCPTLAVTRDQMAVFLLRGEHGGSYTPPAATGAMFGDISSSHWAAAWIEQLANEGITGGCGSGNYCPATPVTRDQMAVFLVRAFSLP